MQKWEYLEINTYNEQDKPWLYIVAANGEKAITSKISELHTNLIVYLNSLGEQGWEMIHVDGYSPNGRNYFFKRQIE